MTARFTTLQKVILLLLAAMTVIFALLTAVSRSRPAGDLHLLAAQNPVFLITGVRP